MSVPELASRAAADFAARFGVAPTHAAAAPGRVNLIGEHTDYSEGLVLPMAIDLACVCVGRLALGATGPHRVWSGKAHAIVAIDLDIAPGPHWRGKGWSAYVAGVLARLVSHTGTPLPAMDIAIQSDVPLGAGLSSSAALEVSIAALAASLAGLDVLPADLARIGREAEREYAGVPCGIMDQLVSACAEPGTALLIDCRDERTRPITLDPLADMQVLVIDSTVKHALVSGEYERRARGCAEAARILGISALRDATPAMIESRASDLGDELTRYARHVVTENARVVAFVEALERGRTESLGSLMLASHASLRHDFRVSCPELDAIVEIAQSIPGVLGCRMTGGGFGGSAVVLARSGAVGPCIEIVTRTMKDRRGIAPRSFVVTPSAGARAWKL